MDRLKLPQYRFHKLIKIRKPRLDMLVYYPAKPHGWGVVEELLPDGRIRAFFSIGFASLDFTDYPENFRQVAKK